MNEAPKYGNAQADQQCRFFIGTHKLDEESENGKSNKVGHHE
jgi:hypothetical protein